MRHVSLVVMTAAAALSLCSCASDMQRDTTEARSYQRQRAIASSLRDRNDTDSQLRQQMQQEKAIERAGGSPIPR